MQPDEAPLTQIHDATVWRDSTRVFDRLSLTIRQHQRVAVLGPETEVLTRELLSEVYETDLRLSEIKGHYFPWPAA